jgi:hypothetical protein
LDVKIKRNLIRKWKLLAACNKASGGKSPKESKTPWKRRDCVPALCALCARLLPPDKKIFQKKSKQKDCQCF